MMMMAVMVTVMVPVMMAMMMMTDRSKQWWRSNYKIRKRLNHLQQEWRRKNRKMSEQC